MKVTILGCGSSNGVPTLGCKCATCTSDNPKNRRTRSSMLIEHENANLLIDTSPDLNHQFYKIGFQKIDAVIYTHAHSDHCCGINDMRAFNRYSKKTIPAYGDEFTMKTLNAMFPYIFTTPKEESEIMKCSLDAIIINPYDTIDINGIKISTFPHNHGNVDCLSIRIGNFAYSTDVKYFSEKSWEVLRGIETWIVGCLRYTSSSNHAHVDLMKEWVKKLGVKQVITTHMGHNLEYEKFKKELPGNISPGYDGISIKI